MQTQISFRSIVRAGLLTAALLALPATAGTLSFFAEEEEEAAAGALRHSGSLGLVTRSILDYDAPLESPLRADSYLETELRFDGESSEAVGRLTFNSRTGVSEFRDLVDEAYLRLYYDRISLQAGYFKTTWGKGDDIHVVDVLNPIDYRDFVNPDYIDRKLAQPMIKLDVYAGREGRLELVWVPVLTPDLVPLEGPWVPREVRALQRTLAASPLVGPGLDELDPADAYDAVHQAGRRFDRGQLGARFTTTARGVDLGALYSFGFYREPVFDLEKLAAAAADPDTPPELADAVDFNRLHLFGLEAATVAAGINLRAELAYLMSDDFAANDPGIPNHSVAYVFGGDRNLGLSNLNLNLQTRGQVDLGKPDTHHTLVATLSDRLRNDRVRPEFSAIHNPEDGDGALRPSIAFVLRDDARLRLRGSFFYGNRDTMFGQFRDTDFVELEFRLMF